MKIVRVKSVENQMDMVAAKLGLDRPPGSGYEAYLMGDVQILKSRDADRLHLSIAHPKRYPTWAEIHKVRYELLPIGKHFVMALPPPQHYLNLHKNCFHLWEVKEESLIWLFEQM